MLLSGACMHLPEGSVDPLNPTSWSWTPLALHSCRHSLPAWTVVLRGGAAEPVRGPALDLHSACLPSRLARRGMTHCRCISRGTCGAEAQQLSGCRMAAWKTASGAHHRACLPPAPGQAAAGVGHMQASADAC